MSAALRIQPPTGSTTNFSQYGKSFQEKIFQGLATDKEWAQQMIEVMNPLFFDLKYLQYICTKYFGYFDYILT